MATIAPVGRYFVYDDNGAPLNGGKIYTYEAGTSTPKVTYTTQAETTANANPVILDADGGADIWLGDGGYKFVVTNSADVELFSTDDLGGNSSAAFGAAVNLLSANTPVTSLYANSVNICTGTLTLSLLSAVTGGEGFYFTVKNNGSGIVTTDPDASELIDGAATLDISPGQSALIISDGSQWYSTFKTFDINGLTELAVSDQIDNDYVAVYDDSDAQNKKISMRNFYSSIEDLPALTSPADDDILLSVDVSNGNSKKIEKSELLADVQPLDAELTAIAGLTSAADEVPYFTGSGTAGTYELFGLDTVGSYAFLAEVTSTIYDFGDTIAGSNLRPTTGAGGISGAAMTGTWQCCGYNAANTSGGNTATLWQKIA